MTWWRRVIYDYDRLGLFACENQSNNPTDKREPKKDVENDGKKIKRQHAKQRDDKDNRVAEGEIL